MWVKIRQTFKHGRDTFVEGERRWLEDKEVVSDFVKLAWAEEESKPGEPVEPADGNVTLDIHPGKLGMRDTNDG